MKLLKIISHRLAWKSILLIFIDIFFFGSINTSKVAQFVLIVGFVLLIANIYLLSYLIVCALKLYGLPIKRKRRISTFCTLFAGLLIALQSVGELSPKDVVVLLPMTVVGYVYISYINIKEPKVD